MKKVIIITLISVTLIYLLITKVFFINDMKNNIMKNDNLPSKDGIYIYIKPECPYCVNAKNLLNEKSVQFIEVDISNNNDLHKKLKAITNQHSTVPYIFINGQFIGGYSQLLDLNNNKQLDVLISK